MKTNLRISLEAAKKRGDPLDHILLNGPPGLGKTTLANIIANEMGWKILAVIGPSLTIPREVAIFLHRLRPDTILFIDEVHRLRRPVQELFYPVLEDGKVQFGAFLDLKPLTVIGATTSLGRLEQPFIDRFPLKFQLEYYDFTTLEALAKINAKKLKFKMDQQAIEAVVRRSRGTPRILNNLLRRLRDVVQVSGQEVANESLANYTLWTLMGIDDLGLEKLDREYLRILDKAPNGMGVDAIATELSQSPETIEDYVEPFLIGRGFVFRGRSGRSLTEAGRRYVFQSTP